MLSIKLPVNSRLLVVKLWGSQKSHVDFDCAGGGGISAPNPCAQG